MSRLICIVLAILILFAFSGCDETPAGAGGSSEPTLIIELPSASASATVTETPVATASAAPGSTATANPGDTSRPEDTQSADGTATAKATGTPKPTATPSNGGTLSVDPIIGRADVSEYLTLRKKPSANSESLKQIPRDGEFTVLQVETGKKWLKVKYEGTTGYVQAEYVAVGSDEDDRVCTVFCDSVLNVREGAGTSHDVIGSVGSGTSLIVKSKTTVGGKTWYEVEIGSSTGYVIAKYCRIAEH